MSNNWLKQHKEAFPEDDESPKLAKDLRYAPLPFVQFLGNSTSHKRTTPSGNDFRFIGNTPVPCYDLDDYQFFAAPLQSKRYRVSIAEGPMTRQRWSLDGVAINATLSWAKAHIAARDLAEQALDAQQAEEQKQKRLVSIQSQKQQSLARIKRLEAEEQSLRG